jgi:hypothetical protein
MTGRLTRQLNNPFAQVGIDDVYPFFVQELIEPALLGEHGFALDHLIDPMLLQKRKDDLVMLRRVGSPMNDGTIPQSGFLELPEISAEIRQNIVFYPGRSVAEHFPIGDLRGGYVAFFADPPKGLVMPIHSRFILIECGRQRGVVVKTGAHASI